MHEDVLGPFAPNHPCEIRQVVPRRYSGLAWLQTARGLHLTDQSRSLSVGAMRQPLHDGPVLPDEIHAEASARLVVPARVRRCWWGLNCVTPNLSQGRPKIKT